MHLPSPEVLQLVASVLGSFVGGLLFIRKVKQTLPQLAAELVRMLGPLLRELLADEVKDLVAQELKPTTVRVKKLEEGLEELSHSTSQLWERQLQASPRSSTP